MDPFQDLDGRLKLVSSDTAFYEAEYYIEEVHIKGDNLRLSDHFAVKASENEATLLNFKTGDKFDLDEEQVDFIKGCDGTQTKAELISQYDDESAQVVEELIVNLHRIGAIEYNSDARGVEISRVPTPRLQTVHFEPFSKCNMFCVHCYQGERYNRKKDNLMLDEIKGLVRQMKAMQVEGISISGGEPFVDLMIFDAVAYIEQCDMRVISFFSNGTLITKDVVKRVKALRSKPAFFISVDSITGYGMSFRSMDRFKGDDCVKKTLKAIRFLVRRGFKVVVNTVLNTRNIQDLERMYDIMKKLGVASWRIGYPKRTGSFAKKDFQGFEVPFDRMLERCLEIIRYHLKQKKPFDLQIEYLYRESLINNFREVRDDEYVCDYESRRDSCCIKPNGDVVSCAYCCDQVIGNIKHQSLWDIWYSKKMRSIKDIRIGDIEGCKDCELRKYCATGCRANAVFLGGDFSRSKDEYACKAVKFFRDNVLPIVRQGCLL